MEEASLEKLLENFKGRKVCLVTDWLTNLGGGEQVLSAVAELFPQAPIFTTVCDKTRIGDLSKRDIRTSLLQKIPYFHRHHTWLLPLLPWAIESLDVSEFDLVLSFSSFGAKSVKTHSGQKHVCYLHTPVRYAWEPDFDPRVASLPFFMRPLVRWILERIRKWDYETRNRPKAYIANSSTTQSRVRDWYGLETDVLYPPVKMDDFFLGEKQDFYLWVGRMVPYKKCALVAKTFTHIPKEKLVIVGEGPEYKMVKTIAKNSPQIEVLGRIDQKALAEKLSGAKALILAHKEDAGIVQLEAFASGTPVMAYRSGGILDVLKEGENGVFFEDSSEAGILEGLERFKALKFDPEKIRESAKAFDKGEFQRRYLIKIGPFSKKESL